MRATLIKIHLWLAAFLSAILLMIAVSGGFYLFSEKGATAATDVSAEDRRIPIAALTSDDLKPEVQALINQIDPSFQFEYVKQSGNTLYTRPMSRTFYELTVKEAGTTVIRHEPDWLKTIVELHKGHGPLLYKRFQQFTAMGLVIILLSGLWLGLSSAGLRKQTLVASGAGVLVFVVLAFLVTCS